MPLRIINTNKFIVRDASSLSIPGQNVKDIRIDPVSRVEYIAKRPSRAGRSEAITECLLNCIGERLGVQMARHKLGICDGELWFMSENFLRPDEALIHGIEFLAQFHKQGSADKLKRRSAEERAFYSIRTVFEGFGNAYPQDADRFKVSFAKMLFLDAIVGCQDRHAKNWGIVRSVKETRRDCLAPVFDTARALFWNFPTTEALKEIGPEQLRTYVRLSSPPIGDFAGNRVNHFVLVAQVLAQQARLRQTLVNMISSNRERSVRRLIETEFSEHIPKGRRRRILECLVLRFERLRQVVRESDGNE